MAAWAQLAAAVQSPSHPVTQSSDPPPTLLDAHNAIYKLTERMAAEARGLRRLITQREARAFRRYEADMLRRFDAILTVTDEDRALLLDLFAEPERSQQAAKLTVVPICVDPATTPAVNHSPLPPGSTDGASYTFVDTAVVAGQTYWYWLEDVDVNGGRTLHGPVSVTYAGPTAVELSGLSAGAAAAGGVPLAAALLATLLPLACAVWAQRRR